MTKQRVYVSNPSDREQMAAILFKNGYTVKLAKETSGKRTTMIVEFWKGEEADDN